MSYNPIADYLDKKGEAIITIKKDEDIVIKREALRVILYHLKQYRNKKDVNDTDSAELESIIWILQERLK